jgi:shikimate dehydrogenase/3-dehydroquinate dehydratase type I
MSFPVNGVIGIIANAASEVGEAHTHGLRSVEIRADLLLAAGLDVAALMAVVAEASSGGLEVLFTLRHPSHGGKFDGTESDRVIINRQALAAGAHIIDAEFSSELATILLGEGAPVILSQHNFNNMLSDDDLHTLTRTMSAAGPLGIKVVPTARRISDAARMLAWDRAADENGPRRIGFAMGAAGASSRILAIAYGSPITYASLGESVAPGQIPLRELTDIYRAGTLNRNTRVYGVAGTHALTSFSPFIHNAAIAARGINAVYVPLQTDDFDDLIQNAEALSIDGLSVTVPYKERALAIAHDIDDRSRRCGASNTLVFDRTGTDLCIRAYNTDFDGVTLPISQHVPVSGLKVAVVGNGGAARGAVEALRAEGAEVTLFYRNAQRGEPVAKALGVSGYTLAAIHDGFDVIINATPLGTHADDPSPVPKSIFARPEQIAFEMLYQNPNSPFLQDAIANNLRTVRGAQMLVAQGTVQFAHFFGDTPSLAEFESAFEKGQTYR